VDLCKGLDEIRKEAFCDCTSIKEQQEPQEQQVQQEQQEQQEKWEQQQQKLLQQQQQKQEKEQILWQGDVVLHTLFNLME
jgi:hypothetical protein